MLKILAFLMCSMFTSCTSIPYNIKAQCAVLHVTNYKTQEPVQQCGVQVEVILLEGNLINKQNGGKK